MAPIEETVRRRSTLAELWDVTRMRLLVEIARQGSLSGAARAIGIGQPTASQHLRLLETAAGQRLVERDGRGSRLTAAGNVLAGRAAQALATLAAGEQELAALAGLKTGTLHVGASTTPGVYLLPGALGVFRRKYPNVIVELEIASSGVVLRRLAEGSLELGVVGSQRSDERFQLDPFAEDEIVGVARPGSLPLRDGSVRPEALAGRLVLAGESGSATRQLAERALAEAGVEPVGIWELGATEAIKRAAREGLGIGFLSGYAVADEAARGELTVFRLAGRPPIRRSLSIARRAGHVLSPSEQEFVAVLESLRAPVSAARPPAARAASARRRRA